MNSASSQRRGVRTRLTNALVAFLSVITTLSACSNPPDAELNRLHPVTAPVDAAKVTMLKPGSEPTSVISYSIPDKADEESAHKVTVDVSEGFEQSTPLAPPQPSPQPKKDMAADTTLTLPLQTRADSAPAPEGPAETEAYRRSVLELTAPATHSDSIQNAKLQEVEEFGARERQLASGAVNSIGIGATQQAPDESKAMLETALRQIVNAQVIFPEEPVGRGASWEVERPSATSSDFIQRTTYTLTSIQGSQVTLDVSITETPVRTTLPISDKEELTVKSSRTESRGKLTVDTSQVLPTAGELSWTTRLVYSNPEAERAVVQDSMARIRFSTPQP